MASGADPRSGTGIDPARADDRRAELAENLARVRHRIAVACDAAGRPVGDVTLIAVTKTYPASDVVHLGRLGVHDVGENRDQEAAPKAAAVAAEGTAVTWHYVGQLQRNKVRRVVRYASVVHSVDRPELVAALAAARARIADVPPLAALVQVNLDGELHRGGAAPEDVLGLAEQIASSPSLRLAGVMAVAPLHAAGGDLDRAFAALSGVSEALRASYPEATVVSAGMSADLEAAIAHGATHVRIGTALLGTRPMLR